MVVFPRGRRDADDRWADALDGANDRGGIGVEQGPIVRGRLWEGHESSVGRGGEARAPQTGGARLLNFAV